MIVGQRKPFEEIVKKLVHRKKVMVTGCATCVAECCAGGQREVEILASQLRIAFSRKKIPAAVSECMIERQCEPQMIEEAAAQIKGHDVILSMACGVGVQEMARRFIDVAVVPALNTTFLGSHVENGVWEERCAGCGNCVLDLTGGICPVTRCGKSLLNGPCGGTNDGNCEISDDVPCAWSEIVERLAERGELHLLEEIQPPKDWSTDRHGGPRRLEREDVEE